jgi:hypothetical protein
MIVQVVRTPTEFARTLAADVCRINHWVVAPSYPPIAVIEDAIDRTYTERADGADDETLADRIQDMSDPLQGLQEDGFQLVAMLTRGHCVLPEGDGLRTQTIAVVQMADYLFAPAPCYFRRQGGPFEEPIHALGHECGAGHRFIVSGPPEQREKTFEVWTSLHAVRRDFELSVPWCPECKPDAHAPWGT